MRRWGVFMKRLWPKIIGMAVCVPLWIAPLNAQQTSEKARPLATVDGRPITEAELGIEAKLIQLQQEAYQARLEALGNAIAKRLIEKEAAKRNISAQDLVTQEVDSKLADPTPDEVQKFYEAQKSRIKKPLEEVEDQVVKFLKDSRKQEARQKYVEGLREKSDVRILLDPPRLPVRAGNSPRRGPVAAPVTIVEFSDFQCPYCKRVQPTLLEVLDKYKGQVSLVYKDLPLRQIHPAAQKAAEAARCAGDEGKFWEYHDKLFALGRVTKEALPEIASELGLNPLSFSECLDSGKYKSVIDADFDQGVALGAQSTPIFYVNGIQFRGAQPVSAFSQLIDAELAAKKSSNDE
jgi:protein-disulfide isomerase